MERREDENVAPWRNQVKTQFIDKNLHLKIILSRDKSLPIIWYILVCGVYNYGHTIVSSIVVVGALTRCALLHSMYDLKAAQMDLQYSLIHKLILNKFKLSHKAVEATKNICEKCKSQ